MESRPLPRSFHVVLALVAVTTAIAGTWPVVAHLSDHVVDGARLADPAHPEGWWPANAGADVLTTVWILNWVLHALVTQPLHLFEANIFYPAPRALARSEHLFATALLGTPGALFGGPVAAHQTALLLCVALNAWCMAYVVTRWSGSLVAGVVAAVLFALSPFHQQSLAHIQNLGTAYFPLLLFGLDRFGATGRPRWLALGAAALALQILSGQYLAYFALIVWGLAGSIVLLAGRGESPGFLRRVGRDGAWLVLATSSVALVVLPFALPYFAVRAAGELPEAQTAMLKLASVRSLGGYIRPDTLQPWTRIAPALWILVAAGVVALARQEHRGRVRLTMLVAIGLAGALLSLGPKGASLGVYEACAALLPGFKTMREPLRAGLMTHLSVAMIAGMGAGALTRRLPRLGVLVVAATVSAALVTYSLVLIPLRGMPVGEALPPVYRYLARCGAGDPLVELPAAPRLAMWEDAVPTFFSTFHWLPLLNGRTGYSPPLQRRMVTLAGAITRPEALAEVRRVAGLRWVLVRCGKVRGPAQLVMAPLCGPIASSVGTVHEFGSVRLYDLGSPAALPRPWPPRWPAAPDCASEPRTRSTS